MRVRFAKWVCDRLTEDTDYGKKNHLFGWSPFRSWWICKQAKLSHLGYRKPARIHWKDEAPKTSHCLVRTLVQRYNWAIFLRKWARRGRYSQWRSLSVMLNEFLFTQIEEEDIGNICFQQDGAMCHTAQAALDILRPVFEDRIIISATELMSFGHLRTPTWHRWTIICLVPSKISVMPTSQRQLTL